MPRAKNLRARRWLPFVILGVTWGQTGCYQILSWDQSSAGPATSCESGTLECLNDQTDCCDSFPVAAEQPRDCTESIMYTFRLDAYEVTVGRFKAFVASKPKSMPTEAEFKSELVAAAMVTKGTSPTYLGGDSNMPMNYVTWQEANDFCIWDKGYLATWTELRSAASDKLQKFPWGDGVDSEHATFGGVAITPVGQTIAGMSLYGQFDLVGNVREWTGENDRCDKTSSGTSRVVFGGSFRDDEAGLQQVSRSTTQPPDERNEQTGFRCARKL